MHCTSLCSEGRAAENVERPPHSKDALLLGELARAQRPEVDVGLAAGDDVGAVVWVELHGKHGLVCTLQDENIDPVGFCFVFFLGWQRRTSV